VEILEYPVANQNHPIQVAYCGLFCGDCIIRRGALRRLATELLEEIDRPEFQKLARGLPVILPEEFESLTKLPDCRSVLLSLTQLDCTAFCREGGGSASCNIKQCCQRKKIEGCWKCEQFETCNTLAWLQPVNGDAQLQNLRIIRDRGMENFLAGDIAW
jgi:hypothetical protein